VKAGYPIQSRFAAVEKTFAANPIGGAFALAAWNGFIRAAEILKSEGSFSELANVASYADINGFLSEDLRERGIRTRAQGAGV